MDGRVIVRLMTGLPGLLRRAADGLGLPGQLICQGLPADMACRACCARCEGDNWDVDPIVLGPLLLLTLCRCCKRLHVGGRLCR